MEALELLGSRYIKPEQVAVGPVETLRAQNAATWRVVLIHRVSTTQEATEQANLLKLLTTALVRSSEAKRLVLDFGEEQGFWNVVTESEPQCESLRDWLQAEVDGAEKGEAILSAEQAAAMGEFARLFARGAKHLPRKLALPKSPPKATIPPAQPPVPVAVEAQAAPEPAPPVTAIPAEHPPALTEELALPPPAPAAAEVIPEPQSQPKETDLPIRGEEEVPVVVVDEIPVIVITAPPDKVIEPAQFVAESKRPLEDAAVSPPPPRPFVPLAPPPVDQPINPTGPLRPEIVAELPKFVADAPKVIPIDGRPHEPKADAPKADAVRTEPPIAKAVARLEKAFRHDGPMFANSMPKAARLSKMAVFFIILGVVALLLVLVVIYLSNRT